MPHHPAPTAPLPHTPPHSSHPAATPLGIRAEDIKKQWHNPFQGRLDSSPIWSPYLQIATNSAETLRSNILRANIQIKNVFTWWCLAACNVATASDDRTLFDDDARWRATETWRSCSVTRWTKSRNTLPSMHIYLWSFSLPAKHNHS